MDKETLRRVVGGMFQELRDSAIRGVEEQVRYLRWSAKPRVTESYSFHFSPLVLDFTSRGGIPEDQWDDATLEKMHRGLTDRRVNVEVLGEDQMPIQQIPVPPSTSSKLPRVHNVLRHRLLDTIESVTGRPVVSRSSKHPDPRRSDPQPPNSYKWAFSQQYPSFANTKGGLSRWAIEDIRRCHEALDRGYLIAVDVAENGGEQSFPTAQQNWLLTRNRSPPTDTSQDEQSEQDERSGSGQSSRRRQRADSESSVGDEPILVPPNTSAEMPSAVETDTDLQQACQAFKQELDAADHVSTSSHTYNVYMKEFFGRMLDDVLYLVIRKRTKELKREWEARRAVSEQRLHLQIQNLSSILGVKTQELADARNKSATLENEKQSLIARLSKTRPVQAHIDTAREEGEQEGRRQVLEDFNASMESDLSALRRSHLEQISKVRSESYKEGFEAGREAASATLDKTGASPLSADDIDQHCADFELGSAHHIVTNPNVQNVLNNFATEDGPGTTTPPDSSPLTELTPVDTSGKRIRPSGDFETRSCFRKSLSQSNQPTVETPPSSPDPVAANAVQEHFTMALQTWLDLGNINPIFAAESSITKSVIESSTGGDRRLSDMIKEHSKAAGMMGKQYITAAEVKTLKRYLAGLTLELGSSIPLPNFLTCDDTVAVFQAIHVIFQLENEAPTPAVQRIAQGSARSNSTPLPSQGIKPSKQHPPPSTQPLRSILKRKRSENPPGHNNKRQQPPTSAQTKQPLPWQVISFPGGAMQTTGAASTNDDCILVDDDSSPRRENKTDDGLEQEDLYGATPPAQRAKRNGLRSSSFF